MHTFDLWAPFASSVTLELRVDEGSELTAQQMAPQTDGWWSVSVADAGAGSDYAFRLDGGPPRPDPRSAWQPSGVHGPSRVFESSTHRWQDDGWPGRDIAGAVIYELHVGTFTPEGTLAAATEKLDYLNDLGVEVVELMPVNALPGERGWGYDAVSPYSVHHAYGGPAALQRFVDAAHRQGLAVCLDVVHNHFGPEGSYQGEFGPYFNPAEHTPWGSAINLDVAGSPNVRAYLIDSALRWLRDFHIDALRLDAVHQLHDHSPRHFLAELSEAVADLSAELGRPLSLIAESDLNDPIMLEATQVGGYGLSAQWSDDVHHALRVWLSGQADGYYIDYTDPKALSTALTEAFWLSGRWSTFRGQPWGHPIDPARQHGHQFVAYIQSHDQVGNRALGDRLGQGVSAARAAAAAAVILTSAFTPMLFMGQEWNASTPWQYFAQVGDPALAQAIRQGRRAEFSAFGWQAEDIPDPMDPLTFTASKLNWSEREQGVHAQMLAWYRDLIRLRRTVAALREDDLRLVRADADAEQLLVRRGELLIAINLSGQPWIVDHPVDEQLLAWGEVRVSEDRLILPRESVAIARAASPV